MNGKKSKRTTALLLQLGIELRNDLIFNKVEALFERIEVNR